MAFSFSLFLNPFLFFPLAKTFFYSLNHLYSTPWASMLVHMCCQAYIHPCGVY